MYKAVLVNLIFICSVYCTKDYWSDDFDEAKNCEQKELMEKLQGDASRCTSFTTGSDKVRWEECKTYLGKNLAARCPDTKIEKVGILLYCKIRGTTSCCFYNESCSDDYFNSVQGDMEKQSEAFLKAPDHYIKKMVDDMKYDNCYRIRGTDASKCAADCEESSKSDFAKKCAKNQGLFKCCIRRDKEFCHECRYCCSLSMCTSKDGTIFKNTGNITAQKNKEGTMDAAFGFDSHGRLYKKNDFRCLKPDSKRKPEKWSHYNMEEYRSAKTEEDLKKVKEIKHDKYFFNFEDPEIYKQMMHLKKGPKIWRKTFGFDFASLDMFSFKCHSYCYKAEKRKFAKKCRKKNGFFKCCYSIFGLGIFEDIRHSLYDKQLLKGKPPKKVCVQQTGNATNCDMCGVTEMCSTKNIFTGLVKHEYKTSAKRRPQYDIGGGDKTGGLRHWICNVFHTCKLEETYTNYQFYIPHKFRMATNKEEFCNLTQISINDFSKPEKRNETYQAAYYKECMRQSTKNIIICPNSTDLQLENSSIQNNTILNNELKKLRSKRSRRTKKPRKKNKRACGKRNNRKCKKKRRLRRKDTS